MLGTIQLNILKAKIKAVTPVTRETGIENA